MEKGKGFESQVNKVCDYINKTKGFAHKLCPERTINGIFKRGEPFDYIILLDKYKCVFDAKECKSDTWRIYEKDIKQCNELKKCKNVGLDAYFLICYENRDVKQIDVDIVIETLKNNKKSIKNKDFPDWKLLEIIKEK